LKLAEPSAHPRSASRDRRRRTRTFQADDPPMVVARDGTTANCGSTSRRAKLEAAGDRTGTSAARALRIAHTRGSRPWHRGRDLARRLRCARREIVRRSTSDAGASRSSGGWATDVRVCHASGGSIRMDHAARTRRDGLAPHNFRFAASARAEVGADRDRGRPAAGTDQRARAGATRRWGPVVVRDPSASARVAVVSTAADFFARRVQKPEVDRSERARRLRSARSVTVESAAAVHAVHGPG